MVALVPRIATERRATGTQRQRPSAQRRRLIVTLAVAALSLVTITRTVRRHLRPERHRLGLTRTLSERITH